MLPVSLVTLKFKKTTDIGKEQSGRNTKHLLVEFDEKNSYTFIVITYSEEAHRNISNIICKYYRIWSYFRFALFLISVIHIHCRKNLVGGSPQP